MNTQSTVRYFKSPGQKIYKIQDDCVYYWFSRLDNTWRDSVADIDLLIRDCKELSEGDVMLELM